MFDGSWSSVIIWIVFTLYVCYVETTIVNNVKTIACSQGKSITEALLGGSLLPWIFRSLLPWIFPSLLPFHFFSLPPFHFSLLPAPF